MLIRCGECRRVYDDADCWTLCPHFPLGADAGGEGYCRDHDMYWPCRACAVMAGEKLKWHEVWAPGVMVAIIGLLALAAFLAKLGIT